MDPSQFPPCVQAFLASASLAEDGEDLDMELSTEIQGLENYPSYIFRLSLEPMPDLCAQTVKADVYHSRNPSRGEEHHVALLTGNLLTRPHPNFCMDADAVDGELEGLASLFFDPTGNVCRLRNEELSNIAAKPGGFLWIYKVEVEPTHRGRDLGLELVQQTLIFLKEKWTLAVMQPEPLSERGCEWQGNAPIDDGTLDDALEEQKLRRHFSRLGFVQAGRDVQSACAMYLTADKFFPSGNTFPWITKEDAQRNQFCAPTKHLPQGVDKLLHDIVLYKGSPSIFAPHPFPLPAAELAEIVRLLSAGASIHQSRALHVAARQGADIDLLRKLVAHGGDFSASDESGNTALHEAASCISPSIPDLVKLGARGDVKNKNDATPFDLLLQAAHVQQATIGTFDEDRPRPERREMRNLRNAIRALLPNERSSHMIDGCLSPRMHKMLLITAEKAAEAIMDNTIEVFRDNPSNPLYEFCVLLAFLEFIPSDELSNNRDRFDSSFMSGWADVFSAIAECLKRRNVPIVQSVQRILRDWKRCEGNDGFFNKGGRIEFGLDALICVTEDARRNNSELWSYTVSQAEIELLPESPLDDRRSFQRGEGNVSSRM